MIEITAKLCRGSVYFASEMLKCYVTFRNPVPLEDQKQPNLKASNGSLTNGDLTEMLAWSGVQIHCHCTIDESKVQFVSEPSGSGTEVMATSSNETSFHPCQGERGHVVFSTKPKILFCDLTLAANESKTFVYQETIPLTAPPSYYGSSVKYLYKLTVGTQRVNAVIQLLRMPLRVLAFANNQSDNNLQPKEEQPPEIVSPSNSFPIPLQTEPKESTLDIVLHKLDCLTARRSPSSFIITNPIGRVVRFCLLKSTFKLGEDIIGIFNFADAAVPCVQLSVTLQSEETISEECRANQSKTSTHTTNYSKYHEYCLDTTNTQMILPIPLTVTPTFNTNIVSLTWRLHFEFVTTKPEEVEKVSVRDSQGEMFQSPSNVTVQTMVWDLPLTVYPTHPVQVARGLQMPASSTLTV